MISMNYRRIPLAAVVTLTVLVGSPGRSLAAHAPKSSDGIHKIRHVIVIMQENRSFDSYFGTYPGANGIPMRNGVPYNCVPDPATSTCVVSYHNAADVNYGGPHSARDSKLDVDGGRMDGFIGRAERGGIKCTGLNTNPRCLGSSSPDVMGYHDRRELQNYWTYADDFVLQDNMFEPNSSWSLPEHLFMVSEWSAKCAVQDDPSSCVNQLQSPDSPDKARGLPIVAPNYAWTDLTYLLHKQHVDWGYYVFSGMEPDTEDNTMTGPQAFQTAKTPGIWNPLPYFTTVRQDGELGNIKSIDEFYSAARAGTLPAVSWICPNGNVSEHPPARVSVGQAYVTKLVNTVMQGPDWNSTAIFLAWG